MQSLRNIAFILLFVLSGALVKAASLEGSAKVFRWQDEGGDVIPRILPSISLTIPVNSVISVNMGSQILGYGHQFGNLFFKASTGEDRGFSVEFVHSLFDEFPSNGFREYNQGFDPEHFMLGGDGWLTFYRLGYHTKSNHGNLRLQYENKASMNQEFAKICLGYDAYLGNFLAGISTEVFLSTLSQEWVRYELAGKRFDVNIMESPTYLNLGYRKLVGEVEYSFITSFLASFDVGPKLGPCGEDNVCREGATDGFSPLYSKIKFQGFVRIPFEAKNIFDEK